MHIDVACKIIFFDYYCDYLKPLFFHSAQGSWTITKKMLRDGG